MEVEEVKYYVSPIANPMATDSLGGKLLQLTQQLNEEKTVRRGVKDVVKAIRKGEGVGSLCLLAADVTPVDVISHIPILCEDNSIPYIYVRSREELGTAADTKKPTSVVLLLSPTDKSPHYAAFTKLHTKISSTHPYL